MLTPEKITLLPYTKQRCHEFFQLYIPDEQMTFDEYIYDKEKVEEYYTKKVLDANRRYFAICIDGETIGEIQLKYIDFIKGYGTLSIVIGRDKHKNKGYGSQAIRQILKYAKEELRLSKVYADAIHRNQRSQHVLEGIGFEFIKEDEALRFYQFIL